MQLSTKTNTFKQCAPNALKIKNSQKDKNSLWSMEVFLGAQASIYLIV